jgi:N-acetylglucosamine kinase-like BadF-type ATPase
MAEQSQPQTIVTLGIDAGGTSSKAAAFDDDKLIWRSTGPAINVATASMEEVQRRLAELLHGCSTPGAVCGGFAGLTTEHQRGVIEGALEQMLPRARIKLAPDFEIALEACAPQANVCVIAGTGSIVSSRVDGVVKTTGGRGYVLGDEGSGFQFGRDAFLAYLDGSSEQTSTDLEEAVENAFGTRSKSEAIADLYSGGIATKLASLAPALAADAANQAIYALKSLRTNMAKLAHLCRQHLKRYGPASPVIGCQGGLWNSSIYREAFLDAVPLWCELSADSVKFDLDEPVEGAARLARSLLVD